MSDRVLVTMQVTTHKTMIGDEQIEDRLAALIHDCFDDGAEHASVSVQPYDPDEPAPDDVCATCGCVIGDPEQHAAWHAAQIRALAAGVHDEPEPRLLTFGEEPAHA